MRIKKSALLLFLLATGSVCLLIFSAEITPAAGAVPVVPIQCAPEKSCSQINEPVPVSTWDVISQMMWRAEA